MADGGRWFRVNTTWSQSEWLAVLPPASRLAWVELIGYVKAHGYDGKVRSVTPAVFGRMVGIESTDVSTLLTAAIEDGALEHTDGNWIITGWREHQGDPSAKTRMRRYRGSVTEVTRNDRSVTPTETETETEKKNPSGSKKKKALPEDWQPNEKHIAMAAQLGLDAAFEAEKMRDWAASQAVRRVDWDAAFRNWLRNAKPHGTSKAAAGAGSNGAPSVEPIKALLRLGGDALWFAQHRPSALQDIAEADPEGWQRYGHILQSLRYGDLNKLRDNSFDFNAALKAEVIRVG